MHDQTQLLTTAQAAKYLGYNPGTLRNLRSNDLGPAFYRLPSGHARYRKADLDKYIRRVSTKHFV